MGTETGRVEKNKISVHKLVKNRRAIEILRDWN